MRELFWLWREAEAPNAVVPKPIAGKAGVTLELRGKSVAVVRIDL